MNHTHTHKTRQKPPRFNHPKTRGMPSIAQTHDPRCQEKIKRSRVVDFLQNLVISHMFQAVRLGFKKKKEFTHQVEGYLGEDSFGFDVQWGCYRYTTMESAVMPCEFYNFIFDIRIDVQVMIIQLCNISKSYVHVKVLYKREGVLHWSSSPLCLTVRL